MKTSKIVGLSLIAGAVIAGVVMWQKGWFGNLRVVSGVAGMPLQSQHNSRSKVKAHQWMESMQAYRNVEEGLSLQGVNRYTGASDEVSQAFYDVLQRKKLEDPTVYQHVGPSGIGRPD